jgi:hypothetical protein
LYKEPHLQKKSEECAAIWYEWWHFQYEIKDEEKAKELRKKWSECVDKHGEMISQEVKTNPRYKELNLK